jgi:uncharacterized protein with NAD-binding domain and iron-sulfur cluster
LRVAVLGGGCGGVAAAFRLSRTPELRERIEVTLYQQGFRLGGKGATGRNAARAFRIEEHGLHFWLGFYRRSFSMMRECLEEWRALPANVASAVPAAHVRIEDMFSPHYKLSLCAGEARDGRPDIWHLALPPRPGRPWDDVGPLDVLAYPAVLARWVTQDAWVEVLRHRDTPVADLRRQARIMAALAATIVRGLVIDVVPRGWQKGMDRLDDLDLRAWLARHGASASEVNDAPPVRAIYDLAFAYPDGVSGRGRGEVAAGAALQVLLRILFAYRGAPFWRMRAGMGDTVFAPLYDVLAARGVRVAFFHRATGLRVGASGRRIARVELREQARVRGSYDPLVAVGGRRCWPGAPRWDALEDGAALAASNADFEASAYTGGVKDVALVDREDFDAVVLAIPVGALPSIAGELIREHAPFGAMIDGARTVATWAMQLWLRPSLEELGWGGGSTVMTSFGAPFGSWADMTEVAGAEGWPQHDRPGAVVYFCDVARPSAEGRTARDEVERGARRFCAEQLPKLWPAMAALARGDESMFVGGLGDQYFRANVEPSERYVLSVPGSTRLRLRPDESGFENLFLAGDWTRTSINGGSVEAAVESGSACADAIVARFG